MDFTFITVDKIIFGPGRFRDLGKEVAALGSKALLVAGRNFLRRTGRLAEIEEQFREFSLELVVFDAVPPEPSLKVVEDGIAMLRDKGCDVVVAVGGGSALDAGKAIAGIANAPGMLADYFHGREIERKGLPFIAASTTAGSGAEVTPNAVFIDETRGIKASIRSAHLMADTAIVDPELMASCPPDVTAHSGMDALCQAIEAYVSKGATPLTDTLAVDAAVRLIRNLPMAYDNGDDLNVRGEVALGSLMGGMAFTNARLGLVHGLAHPIGFLTGLPHGLLCGLLLPAVMRFNIPVSAAKYANIARLVGVAGVDTSDDDAASSLISEMDRLNAYMGLEVYKPKLRIPSDAWPEVTAQTLASGSTKSDPREVTMWDIQQILDAL